MVSHDVSSPGGAEDGGEERRDRAPAIESRQALLDEVILEYLESIDRGVQPDPGEVVRRYPACASELEEFFAAQDELGAWRCGVRPLDTRRAVVAPIQPPARLGDYEILDAVARGGMSTVYRARQVSLGRFVALKVFDRERTWSDDDDRRIRLEAEAVASLDPSSDRSRLRDGTRRRGRLHRAQAHRG